MCKFCSNFYKGDKQFELKSNQKEQEILKQLTIIANSYNNIYSFDHENTVKNIKLRKCNDSSIEKTFEEDENKLYEFLRIILKDNKVFPNTSHTFNIPNFYYSYIKEDKKNNQSQYNNTNLNSIDSNDNDELIIDYFNNNSKMNLFSENFVENNKYKVYLEIEGKNYELKSQHKFKSNENKMTIKLIVKESTEIDMSEMFLNCNNLISLNGISKWKKTKIINQYKMFYNCTSLISIPDINDWHISPNVNIYLMFYNCISLVFFPNSVLETINNNYNNNIDLGLSITEYYQNGKEIILQTMIENNEERINLYGNVFTTKKDYIMVFNGNENNLILCQKKDNIKKK